MTHPGKISAQAGFKPGIFRSRGGRLNHYANEAVVRADLNVMQRPKNQLHDAVKEGKGV